MERDSEGGKGEAKVQSGTLSYSCQGACSPMGVCGARSVSCDCLITQRDCSVGHPAQYCVSASCGAHGLDQMYSPVAEVTGVGANQLRSDLTEGRPWPTRSDTLVEGCVGTFAVYS